MSDHPTSIPRRTVAEWTLRSDRAYDWPFADVTITARLTDPNGTVREHPGYYDGDGIWKVRFNPGIAGEWTIDITSRPANPDLAYSGTFTVTDRQARGSLRSTPDVARGFTWEDGTPFVPFGDTVYNLIGFHYCDHDVTEFVDRRIAQGFNLLRVRIPVSPFHPPAGMSDWQTKRISPWNGSETAPVFHEMNLDWFRCVDEIVALAEDREVAIEMVMEAYGFEFPWNSRSVLTPEWEELYLRYIVARYDAFNAIAFWTPMNEYEYYPNGKWNNGPDADRWLLRISRWIKDISGHNTLIAAHNGPQQPAFAHRFRADPDAIDTVMFQTWGSIDADNGWLAEGIERAIDVAFEGWTGSKVLAEYGYEMTPEFERLISGHDHCDRDHTRRGALRGLFHGMGVISGFEYTWGPWCVLDRDQPGVADLERIRRLIDEIPYTDMHPADDLMALAGGTEAGYEPQILATADRATIAAYLPAGGSVRFVDAPAGAAQWWDPRTGDWADADPDGATYATPATETTPPDDWVLVIRATH